MKLHELYDRSVRPPSLDSIMLAESPASPDNIWVLNEERKWVKGRFERNIGIDQPSHLHGTCMVTVRLMPTSWGVGGMSWVS